MEYSLLVKLAIAGSVSLVLGVVLVVLMVRSVKSELRSKQAFADATGDASTHVQRVVLPDIAEALLPLRGKLDCTVPVEMAVVAGEEESAA